MKKLQAATFIVLLLGLLVLGGCGKDNETSNIAGAAVGTGSASPYSPLGLIGAIFSGSGSWDADTIQTWLIYISFYIILFMIFLEGTSILPLFGGRGEVRWTGWVFAGAASMLATLSILFVEVPTGQDPLSTLTKIIAPFGVYGAVAIAGFMAFSSFFLIRKMPFFEDHIMITMAVTVAAGLMAFGLFTTFGVGNEIMQWGFIIIIVAMLFGFISWLGPVVKNRFSSSGSAFDHHNDGSDGGPSPVSPRTPSRPAGGGGGFDDEDSGYDETLTPREQDEEAAVGSFEISEYENLNSYLDMMQELQAYLTVERDQKGDQRDFRKPVAEVQNKLKSALKKLKKVKELNKDLVHQTRKLARQLGKDGKDGLTKKEKEAWTNAQVQEAELGQLIRETEEATKDAKSITKGGTHGNSLNQLINHVDKIIKHTKTLLFVIAVGVKIYNTLKK